MGLRLCQLSGFYQDYFNTPNTHEYNLWIGYEKLGLSGKQRRKRFAIGINYNNHQCNINPPKIAINVMYVYLFKCEKYEEDLVEK